MAFTFGNSCKATEQAFRKNDMKPNLVPCSSTKALWYFLRISMMGFISTSLNVVSMAVSFFTDTNRSLNFLRNELSRLLFDSRLGGFLKLLLETPSPRTAPKDAKDAKDASTSSRFKRLNPLRTSSTDKSCDSITFFARGVIFMLSCSPDPLIPSSLPLACNDGIESADSSDWAVSRAPPLS